MLDWISEKIMDFMTIVPAMIVDQESATFPLVRTMFGLLFITAFVYAMAVLTSRISQKRRR